MYSIHTKTPDGEAEGFSAVGVRAEYYQRVNVLGRGIPVLPLSLPLALKISKVNLIFLPSHFINDSLEDNLFQGFSRAITLLQKALFCDIRLIWPGIEH